MKKLICLALALCSLSSFAMSPESAQELIEINTKSFSTKQLVNNVEMCQFHNSLVDLASPKFKNEKLQCSRSANQTDIKDEELKKQLDQINASMSVTDMQHPEQDNSIEQVADFATKKMKAQGFSK